MNLGKLLIAGKSIINGRREISYRVNKLVYLPKFGPTQNPFLPPAGTELVHSSPEAVAPPAVKSPPPAGAKTQKLPARPPGPIRATSWTSKFNPISIWREAHPAENAPTPVQSELSLDSVKVVHNDLSDADVEVVPMKSRTADAYATPEPTPSNRPWEALAERVFHVATH